jgi:hypothetical protein
MRTHEDDPLDEPLFLISEVAKAADMEANTIRSWFQRGHLKLLQWDKKADANGVGHRFSLRSALYIAAVGALARLGVKPDAAGKAAAMWVHTGTDERLPAGLYSTPLTVLCVYADGDSAVKHMPLGRKADALSLFIGHGQRQPGVSAVILDFVDKQVRTTLEARV